MRQKDQRMRKSISFFLLPGLTGSFTKLQSRLSLDLEYLKLSLNLPRFGKKGVKHKQSVMETTTTKPTSAHSGTRVIHDEEKGHLYKSTTGVTMSPELFEKLYLTPKVPRVGDYNRRFANPTALGFVGYVLLSSPRLNSGTNVQ